MTKPVLFIDFDRTLFDTDKFYEWLGPNRFSRILGITAGVTIPPDYPSYVYPDSVDFLQKVGKTHRRVLLTYSVNTIFQRKKVKGSGILPFFEDVIITQREKGDEAKAYLERLGDSGWEHAFIDDTPENISSMKKVNPDIRTIRIDRTSCDTQILFEGLLLPDVVVMNLSEALAAL